jgi:hypothetical protein
MSSLFIFRVLQFWDDKLSYGSYQLEPLETSASAPSDRILTQWNLKNLSVAALHLVDVQIRLNKPVLITVSRYYLGLLWKKPLNLNLFWPWGAAAGHFDWSSQDAPTDATDVTDLLPATVPLRCATWLGWPGWGLGWRPYLRNLSMVAWLLAMLKCPAKYIC